MGASLVYLNEPNTEIEHEVGENTYLKFAAGSMQGWRLNMVSLWYKLGYIIIDWGRFDRSISLPYPTLKLILGGRSLTQFKFKIS